MLHVIANLRYPYVKNIANALPIFAGSLGDSGHVHVLVQMPKSFGMPNGGQWPDPSS